ncbi:MAG: SCP2 sterol-binding domain-containing protein [Lewinellaceae bacterium]|nr:SCP2 sterol-binding domain-containing protein [Lewinellaceae bacterium]
MIDPREYLFDLPAKTKPEVLEGHFTIFHFEVDGSGHYTVHVEDSVLLVKDGLHGEAICRVTTTSESFSKLISKDLNPMMAMMTGKLKISNPGEMIKYAKIFGLL